MSIEASKPEFDLRGFQNRIRSLAAESALREGPQKVIDLLDNAVDEIEHIRQSTTSGSYGL